MTNEVTLVVAPDDHQTRLLATLDEHEILKAALPELPSTDPQALTLLFEALARWLGAPLSVVLVVDDLADTSCSTTYAALVETQTLFYRVGIGRRGEPRAVPQSIGGIARFHDLRRSRRRSAV